MGILPTPTLATITTTHVTFFTIVALKEMMSIANTIKFNPSWGIA
jgi:hypothetical protein